MKVKDYFRQMNYKLLTDLTRDSKYWERACWFWEDMKDREVESLNEEQAKRLAKIETQLIQEAIK